MRTARYKLVFNNTKDLNAVAKTYTEDHTTRLRLTWIKIKKGVEVKDQVKSRIKNQE